MRNMIFALVFAGFVFAQTPKAPEPAPKRDITGVWMIRNPETMRAYSGATFTKEEPAMTAWAAAKYKEAKASNNGQYSLEETNDPVLTKCLPPGLPRVYFHPYPFEFVQTPKYTLMLYEYDHMNRRIYTDGRDLPKDPDLSWLGTSVGKWENDTTFVVDTIGLNDRTWIDRVGHPHSTELHVTERFRRIDHDHIELDFILTDAKALAKPWTSTFHLELRPQWELSDISCSGDYLDFSNFEKK